MVVHDVVAEGLAQPFLHFGAGGAIKLKIAGGALVQTNGDDVTVNGLAELQLGAGQDSCGQPAPVQTLGSALVDPEGKEAAIDVVIGP